MNHERFQKCKHEVDVAIKTAWELVKKCDIHSEAFFNWFQPYVRFRVQANRQLAPVEKKERKRAVRKSLLYHSSYWAAVSVVCLKGKQRGNFFEAKEVQQWKRRISMKGENANPSAQKHSCSFGIRATN